MKKVIQVNTASEFIEYLRLTHPIWDMQVPGDTRWISREKWAFRGQSNADWSLTPSAFRANAVLGFKPGAATPSSNQIDRKNQERRALQDFLFFADRMGLKVPGDNIHFRVPQLPGYPSRPPIDFWPWESVLETLAIAQHHGVPTRLLDFTYDPMVAGFFAAYDAWETMGRPNIYKKLEQDGYLAVWAIHLPLIYTSVDNTFSSTPRLILVTAPRAENSYLHHQDGFFMLDVDADANGYPPIEQAIDDIKRDLLSKGETRYTGDQVFQLTLSWNHVPELLAKLWNELYNIAKLQPTHDKAVQALKDHRDLFTR
jgi:hypothetical protein